MSINDGNNSCLPDAIRETKNVFKRATVQETCWVILLVSRNKINQGAVII